jgi:hypothetical protein
MLRENLLFMLGEFQEQRRALDQANRENIALKLRTPQAADN